MRRRGTASLLFLLTFAVGCAGTGPDTATGPAPPVVVIGWDAASWPVLRPLLDEGRLPHLEGLLARGSSGRLVADPPLLSPVLWTTLATGFPPEEHGITDFTLPDPNGGRPILASSFHRRRAALWQIASAAGVDVGFVGWWSSWPAEPVRGWLVSDHLAYNRWDAWAPRPDDDALALTWPRELAARLASVAVGPEAVDEATILPLVPFDPRERREMMAASGPVMFHAPSVYRFGYATDASNVAFAKRLIAERGQPGLLAVLFVLSDVAGHVFWHHYEPEAFEDAPPDAGRLGAAIPRTYEQLDRWTGELLAGLDARSRVLVISDHGMRASGSVPRPGRNPAGDHDPFGILVASGPGIPAGLDLGDVRQLDFTPTVLQWIGAPLARDMPGRPIAPLVDPRRPIRWVDSYGRGPRMLDGYEPSPGEDAYLERLRSLGYIR